MGLPDLDQKTRRGWMLLLTLAGIAALLAGMYAWLAVLDHAAALGGAAVMLAGAGLHLRRSGILAQSSHVIGGSLAASVVGVAVVDGGLHSAVLMGLPLAPILAAFLAGPTSGRIWLAISCVSAVGLFFADGEIAQGTGGPGDMVFRLTAVVVGSAALYGLAESYDAHIRARERSLLDANAALAKARAEADRANVAKSEYLAHMSHELRTPLNGIVGMAEVLATDIVDPSIQERLHLIARSGAALTGIVDDVLDFAKIEASRMLLDEDTLELHATLHDVCALARVGAEKKGVAVHVRIQPTVPRWIRTDPVRLRQIITNLTSNAVKFTAKGAVRVIADFVDDETLVVEVQDSGVGIPEDRSEAIFASFAQSDASTTTRFGGTGLGLTISRELARLMGGDLVLSSSETGVGSTFRLSVPVTIAESPRQAPSGPARVEGLNILVVDDNLVNRTVAKAMLKRIGCSVELVAGGREALDVLHQQSFDVILMDCQMPELDGYQTTRTLRERGDTTRVIALTAGVQAEDRVRCREAGMDGFMSKPITLERLRAGLASARA